MKPLYRIQSHKRKAPTQHGAYSGQFGAGLFFPDIARNVMT